LDIAINILAHKAVVANYPFQLDLVEQDQQDQRTLPAIGQKFKNLNFKICILKFVF
jgi:hypothetical protein